jgi:hypothetical protein
MNKKYNENFATAMLVKIEMKEHELTNRFLPFYTFLFGSFGSFEIADCNGKYKDFKIGQQYRFNIDFKISEYNKVGI